MNWIDFWKEFFSLCEKLAPWIIPLVAVWVGWRLNWYSQRKQRSLEYLREKFSALREIKKVIGNVPPDLDRIQLLDKINTEKKFCEDLTGRLVRLFGLRNELIPGIDPSLVALIDKEMQPLYKIENGIYVFRETRTNKLVEFIMDIKSTLGLIEEKLISDYERYYKL